MDARELFDYVYHQVEKITSDKQHPREFGTFENKLRLSDLAKPGTPIALWRTLRNYRDDDKLYLASADQTPLNSDAEQDVEKFNAAVRDENLLAGTPGNATEALDRLRSELTPDVFSGYQNALRVALETRPGVILRYLAGDQNARRANLIRDRSTSRRRAGSRWDLSISRAGSPSSWAARCCSTRISRRL